jgi:DNA topoisomerase-3
MKKILVVAEKPDMMRKIIVALDPGARKGFGEYEGTGGIVFTHAVGHLAELDMPDKLDPKYLKWKLEDLPFFFDSIPLHPIKDSAAQFKVVKELMLKGGFDEVVNACDADREGELIFRDIYLLAGCKIKEASRMWIQSTTVEGIKEAWDGRKPEKEYSNLAKAAKARAYADYMTGLNGTRAMTTGFGGFGNLLSVGRVQTPTLRIVVDLEKEIKAFKPQTFWTLSAGANAKDGTGFTAKYLPADKGDGHFKTIDEAKAIVSKVGTGAAKITKAEDGTSLRKAKPLFNLSDLQTYASRAFGMSAQNVLDTVQSLYEKHSMVTYPRTDEEHISPELAGKIDTIVSAIANGPFPDAVAAISKNKLKINKSCIASNGKIGAHEALTPTDKKVSQSDIAALNPFELKIYKAICQRFLEQFFPPAEYKTQTVVFERNGESFGANAKSLSKKGFLSVSGVQDESDEGPSDPSDSPSDQSDENSVFLDVKVGDSVDVRSVDLHEGTTKAPARFTEGSLIAMMKNPAKYVDSKDEKAALAEAHGIGTEATRAAIIEQLKHVGYIEIQKKQVVPTSKGIALIDTIPSELLKSVSFTAQMQGKLEAMKDGEYDYDKFMAEVKDTDDQFVADVKAAVKDGGKTVKKDFANVSTKKICDCPICGAAVAEDKYSYHCTSCDVAVRKDEFERLGMKGKVTAKMATELLTKGRTSQKVALHSKAKNKDYQAYLTWTYKKGEKYPNDTYITFDEPAGSGTAKQEPVPAGQEKKLCECPECGGDVVDDGVSYHCVKCDVKIRKDAYARLGMRGSVSPQQAKEMLEKGKTDQKTILKSSKTGKDYQAYLTYKHKKGDKYPNDCFIAFDQKN